MIDFFPFKYKMAGPPFCKCQNNYNQVWGPRSW